MTNDPVPPAPPPALGPGTAPPPPIVGPTIPASNPADLREAVIHVLETVFDPEIPVNIWELGLVYDLTVSPAGEIAIRMTLTSPACPVAESLPPEVEQKIRAIPGVREVRLDLVWDPPWSMSRLSEAAKLQLGFM